MQPMPAHPHSSEKLGPACLAFRARRLSRTISRLYDEELRPIGLRCAQLTLLSVIDQLGPVSPRDLCAALDMDKSTLSRNVGVLCRAGWVREEADRQDERRVHLCLTAGGRRKLAGAEPAWRRAQARARALLGPERLAHFEALFVQDTLADDTPPAREGG